MDVKDLEKRGNVILLQVQRDRSWTERFWTKLNKIPTRTDTTGDLELIYLLAGADRKVPRGKYLRFTILTNLLFTFSSFLRFFVQEQSAFCPPCFSFQHSCTAARNAICMHCMIVPFDGVKKSFSIAHTGKFQKKWGQTRGSRKLRRSGRFCGCGYSGVF